MPVATSKPKPGTGTGRKPNLIEKNLQRLGIKYRAMSPIEKEILATHQAKVKAYRGVRVDGLRASRRRYQQGSTERRVSKRVKAKTPRRGATRTPKRIKYPRWWRDLQVQGINLLGPGEQVLIKARAGYRSFVNSIVFTVSGKTRITLRFGSYGSSGPMFFGGVDEPRGISMCFGDAPAPCGTGSFSIYSDDAWVYVNGFIIYYYEPDEPPP